MNQIRVGILSIGSGVGQSVIESLRLSNFNFYTIGLGNNPLAFGAYECNEMLIIPSFYHVNYIESLEKVCIDKDIHILIPGTDDEALILSQYIEHFNSINIKIIVSLPNLMKLVRDKRNLSTAFNPISNIFLPCFTLDETKELILLNKIKFPLIAKPKDGNASNGINILLSEDDFTKVSSNDVIQELAVPQTSDPNHKLYMDLINKHINPQIAEYSFQVVLDHNGDEIARMVSYNKLKNGVPIEIVPVFDDRLWTTLNPLIPYFKELGARGPINIQGRLTEQGLKCFEINARFTGMTGLRAELGFNEVEKLVLDYLDIKNQCQLIVSPNKIGIRQTTNKSVMNRKNEFISNVDHINSNFLPYKKTILVTGANGYLGLNIIDQLDPQIYTIIALVRDTTKQAYFQEKYKYIEWISLSELMSGSFNFGYIDTIIHTLFARPYRGHNEIKSSLDFTQWLLIQVSNYHIPEFINISSQSVYGEGSKSYPTIELDTLYAQSKYTSELLVNTTQKLNPHLKLVNLRLTTLIGNFYAGEPIDVISKWIKDSLTKTQLVINTNLSTNRLDVRDAATGIIKLINYMQSSTESTYDFASMNSYTLTEIAHIIRSVSLSLNRPFPEIIIKDETSTRSCHINSNSFYALLDWKPSISMEESIYAIYNNLLK
jgi:nucleoside-diphosphate-sugar epimerase